MNYYNTNTNQVITRTLMDYMALPKDDTVLAQLGYFPVTYNYPTVDKELEHFVPEGELIREGDHYVQNFKVLPNDDDTLKSNMNRIAEDKANEARSQADEVAKPYLADYSDVEKQTWPQQQLEVKAYLQNNEVATPTLDSLAEARGISRELMLEKAVAKVTAFEPIAAKIVGKQQAYEDEIKSITNNADLSLVDRINKLRNLFFTYDSITEDA